jgi:hypothetical protein
MGQKAKAVGLDLRIKGGRDGDAISAYVAIPEHFKYSLTALGTHRGNGDWPYMAGPFQVSVGG